MREIFSTIHTASTAGLPVQTFMLASTAEL